MRRRSGAVLAVVMLFAMACVAQQKQTTTAAASGSSDITLQVVKQTNGKPVKYATIVLHSIDKDGNQDKGGINLKSDGEGKAEFRGLPYGTLRIQVIAKGLQTFGEDFTLDKPTHEFTIKLAPPKAQFSIYK